MKEYKVPIQSLIEHIKTSMDVDQWAKDMAEELLSRDIAIMAIHGEFGKCPVCGHGANDKYCPYCGQALKW